MITRSGRYAVIDDETWKAIVRLPEKRIGRLVDWIVEYQISGMEPEEDRSIEYGFYRLWRRGKQK